MSVANTCSDALNEILQNVTKVSSLSQEISQASKEQSQGVAEINKAMTQLDSVTQQNSATSEEAASAAEELSAQAESLKSMVDQLVLVMQGTGKQLPANHIVTKRVEKRASVVPFRSKKTEAAVPRSSAILGTGTDGVPSRSDSGFTDV
jgi:methyl-accepting chemotaxis protein